MAPLAAVLGIALAAQMQAPVKVEYVDANPRSVITELYASMGQAVRFKEGPQGRIDLMPALPWRRSDLLREVLGQGQVEARLEGSIFVIRSTDSCVIATRDVGRVEENGTDIRDALKRLFDRTATRYRIAPDVKGKVTGVSLADVFLETAMQTLLRQVDATYRIEDGVVQIIRRIECDG